jgi:Fe2+ or Zn2+ uptake regulation protein
MRETEYAIDERRFVRMGTFEQFFTVLMLKADTVFTAREVHELLRRVGLRFDIMVVRKYLSVLVKRGVVEVVKEGRDARMKAYSFSVKGYAFANLLAKFCMCGKEFKSWEMK